MIGRKLFPAVLLALVATTAAFTAPSVIKWPPWLSIESPVNPFDATARGAELLVHATFREGQAQLADLTGSAEGLVNGVRRSVPLRFDATNRPSVFALRRQWPTEGSWVLRIALKSTTAIVTIDRDGSVGAVRVPIEQMANGDRVPRAVDAKEIDSMLAEAAKR